MLALETRRELVNIIVCVVGGGGGGSTVQIIHCGCPSVDGYVHIEYYEVNGVRKPGLLRNVRSGM